MKRIKINGVILLPIAILLLSGCDSVNKESEKTMVIEKEDFYLATSLIPPQEVDLAFLNGEKEIAYFQTDTVIEYLSNLTGVKYVGTSDVNKQTYTITHGEVDSSVIFDFKNDEITYTNFDTFFIFLGKQSSIDIPVICTNEPTTGKFMIRDVDSAKINNSGYLKYDCKKYGIDLIWSKNNGYIPVQTFSDMVLSKINAPFVWNGINNLVCLPGGVIDPSILGIIYTGKSRVRSEKLIDFNYRSLCMNLDYNYGLKKDHNIKDFDTTFKNLGYDVKLRDPDGKKSSNAFAEFINLYIDDLHSSVSHVSCYNDIFDAPVAKSGAAHDKLFSTRELLKQKFVNSFGDEVDPAAPWYKESGDTAFVYFSTFNFASTKNYYDEQYAPNEDNTEWFINGNDTFGLIEYAHKMMTREGSPIKKMVLDLSLNTGGAVDCAVGVINWMMGHAISDTNGNEMLFPARIHTKNTATESTFSCDYYYDINLDGKFDKYDFLDTYGIERYCLTSNVSFSCGNFVPSYFKNSGQVTLIGQRSGGGTNAVNFSSTADGTLFRQSSLNQMCSYLNGQYIDIESGAEPDYYIGDTSIFYDPSFIEVGDEQHEIFRGKLIDFIENIK